MAADRTRLRRDLAREARRGFVVALALALACLGPTPPDAAAPGAQAARREPTLILRRWSRACDLSAIINHPLLLAERATSPSLP